MHKNLKGSMMVELILELIGNVAYKRSRFARRAAWGVLAAFLFLFVCGVIYSLAFA